MSFSVIEIRTAKTITDGIQSDADWIRHPPNRHFVMIGRLRDVNG